MARGDHLKINRGGYFHHGIDIGNGEVVHFTGEPLRKFNAQVEREPFSEFAKRGSPQVVPYSDGILHPDHTCIVALKQWQTKKTGYNLISDNCEHLATWCKTGSHTSAQVETFFRTTFSRVAYATLRGNFEGAAAAVFGDPLVRLGKFVTRKAYERVMPGRAGVTSNIPPLYRQCRWWQASSGELLAESITPGLWLQLDSRSNSIHRIQPPNNNLQFLNQEWVAYPDRENPRAEVHLFETEDGWYAQSSAGFIPLTSEQAAGVDNLKALVTSNCPWLVSSTGYCVSFSTLLGRLHIQKR